jgi:hypothetical protein
MGTQMGVIEQTATDGVDGRYCSEPFESTNKTACKNRMALRSRWRRSESCRDTFVSLVRGHHQYLYSRLFQWSTAPLVRYGARRIEKGQRPNHSLRCSPRNLREGAS